MTRKEKLDLVTKFGAAARATQKEYGVPASITVAQAILESSWGQSELAREGNNYFGIKARAGEEYCEFDTTEYVAGVAGRERAKFRKFRSMQESFDGHARLLSCADRYQPAMAVKNDPLAFALQLKLCGYATDPKYPQKLTALIHQYNLTSFDAAGEAATA
ncbi:MAG TPA: glucosaminidase domain-containing protein [Clostridia bacterium]|nr:glucosaminidase domain-containing protein [Clostridia bacterium]